MLSLGACAVLSKPIVLDDLCAVLGHDASPAPEGRGRRRAPARHRWSRGAKAPPDVLPHRAARVLVVDDDADNINMPGLTGTDVLLAIRTVAPKATVIMISGTADADLAKRALAHGAFDYVVKRSMCVIWTRVSRRRSQ